MRLTQKPTPPDGAPLKAIVVGAGHFGRFHAQKYAVLPGVTLATVVDLDTVRAVEVGAPLGAQATSDLAQALAGADVASVVVSTRAHLEVARACLEAGLEVLVEKPIASSLDEAQQLIEVAQRHGRLLAVGHLERFNPAFAALRSRLRDPVFVEASRLAAFKPGGTDVDVILDVMIHDIDLVLAIVGTEPVGVRADGFRVLTDAVDIATARLEFASGFVANLVASRVSQKSLRAFRLFERDAYWSADLQTRRLRCVRRAADEAPGADDPHLSTALASEEAGFEAADPLADEIAAFVAAARTHRTQAGATHHAANEEPSCEPASRSMLATGLDGLRAMATALKVRDRMRIV